MNLKTLGNNISAVRRSLGLTQEEVAFNLNISSTSYAKIERGETNVPFLRLVQIADYFKIDIVNLVKQNDRIYFTDLLSTMEQIKKDINFIQNMLTENSRIQ
ncbi:MAG: helix-turn-helix domain-containing protein [Prevotellaceae bacterium]|jgi:transcriptional regulator with XRE-family HTH domain|nr:helix-turn-helix domain-containing protein [Prevotellaceae bacterium]